MKKHVTVLSVWAATLVMCFTGILCLTCATASAAVPQTLTYSGQLSSDGAPIDEMVSATFRLYDAETGGEVVWQESFETLDVENGRFSVELGAKSPIADVLDGQAYWLGIELNGEALEPRMHVGTMPYAFRAAVADRVGDYTAEELMGSSASSAENVAYDNADSDLQAGDVKAALDALSGRIGALESKLDAAESTIASLELEVAANSGASDQNTSDIAALQTGVADNSSAAARNATDITGLQTGVTDNASAISSLQTSVSDNAVNVAQNTGNIAALQTTVGANTGDISTLQSKTASMSVSSTGEDVYFTGVNVHVRSGSGTTDGILNGRGNLIIGYDEARSSYSDKTGSHNLVVGSENNYSSYAGVVFGFYNSVTDNYATVTGGNYNKASGRFASVSGGHSNEAKIYTSSICGGRDNIADAAYTTISGGRDNKIWADYASISGGQGNIASGQYSSVSGGNNRTASGTHDWRAGTLSEDN